MKCNAKRIGLENGSDAHRLVSRLLRVGVDSKALMKATGQPRQCIAAIKAHNTMGTYEDGRKDGANGWAKAQKKVENLKKKYGHLNVPNKADDARWKDVFEKLVTFKKLFGNVDVGGLCKRIKAFKGSKSLSKSR
jgi:hypothetical protein